MTTGHDNETVLPQSSCLLESLPEVISSSGSKMSVKLAGRHLWDVENDVGMGILG
jgi:hypothetical protein